MSDRRAEEIGRYDRWARQAPEDPWPNFISYMEEFHGTRWPTCQHCGQTVVMALQGFYGGGSWTTNREDEGPLGTGTAPGTTCLESPDGEHDARRIEPAATAATTKEDAD